MAEWSLLHAHLHQTLKQRQLLPKQQRLLVAVSGGQDSLCLLHLLLNLQPKWSWQLGIAHCNHCWRPDAETNASYVRELARALQIPYFVATAPERPKSEASARQWRYQALTEIAVAQNYAYVVTGHTASDRAETLLYNLIRGSGTDGLQALCWQRTLSPEVQLVRPMLTITRTETAAFCQTHHLNVWEDATNQDLKYARNRIRAELLPYLKSHFNPQVEQTLAQTAELLQAEVEYWESATEAWWQQVISGADAASQDANQAAQLESNHPASATAIHRVRLRSAPLALQRRVLRKLLLLLLPTAPTFEHIEKLLLLLNAPNRSQTDPFPGGLIAQVEGDWIRLSTATPINKPD
ncbi:MAG: tRNA lysidine(34) synthetase TilS [Cyanobacteria bacterium RM1_2_2]|nr:tRNA lysidine(34) synthetase TilS [Cyanobacteria bacterium RM1_2_2]